MSADQACLRCRKQKRRCDKILPYCTLCRRLNKRCVYQVPAKAPRLLPMPECSELTLANLGHTLETQVFAIVGDGMRLQDSAAHYFHTVNTWLPILSEFRFNAQLTSMRVSSEASQADFNLLILSMYLVCKQPTTEGIPESVRSLYTSLKGFVAFLEATGTNSLEMLQSRILLNIFEIGHSIYPSAYISAAANQRAAICLGIGTMCEDALDDPQRTRDAKMAWHAISIIDSYVSLENGQSPGTNHREQLEMNKVQRDLADVDMDPFEKLVRASQLLDNVLIHIHATPPHNRLDGIEGLEILKSLTTFMATFQNDHQKLHNFSDSALALSRSAMLEVLETGSRMDAEENFFCVQTAVNILQSLVIEVGHGVQASNGPSIDTASLSVFLPHFLFKAVMVYLDDSRVSGRTDTVMDPGSSIQPIKTLLGHLAKRWVAAKRYLEKIEIRQRECGL